MEVVLRPCLLAALPLIGVALASCAPVPAGDAARQASARPCFLPQQVTNFRDNATTQSIYLKVGAAGTYQLQASGFCRGLDGAISLAIVPDTGGRICAGDWARIAVGGVTPETCRVQVTKRLTSDEIAALPSRDRP